MKGGLPEVGPKFGVAPVGRPDAVRVTGTLNSPISFRVSVNVVDSP